MAKQKKVEQRPGERKQRYAPALIQKLKLERENKNLKALRDEREKLLKDRTAVQKETLELKKEIGALKKEKAALQAETEAGK